MKHHAVAGTGAQLCLGAGIGAGFVQDAASELGHLIGADDHRVVLALCNGFGFGARQTHGACRCRLAGKFRFIHPGRALAEGEAEAAQQIGAVA
jgi:hypothetical protein